MSLFAVFAVCVLAVMLMSGLTMLSMQHLDTLNVELRRMRVELNNMQTELAASVSVSQTIGAELVHRFDAIESERAIECEADAKRADEPVDAAKLLVLVPFVERQWEAVVRAIERWDRVEPFGARRIDERAKQAIEIAFYYHKSEAEHHASVSLRKLELAVSKLNAFDRLKVHYLYANLTAAEDAYPEGANRMFYRLFLRGGMRAWLAERFEYMMILESDVRPIRPGWATKLFLETKGSPFWMKGSQFHGRYVAKHIRYHINGNALYNVRDERFVELIDEVQRTYSLKMGYDLNLMVHMLDDRRWKLWHAFAHKFVYSDFIRNMHWTEFSLAEHIARHRNTFLIHNGNNTDDPSERVQYTHLPADYF